MTGYLKIACHLKGSEVPFPLVNHVLKFINKYTFYFGI